MPLSSADRSRLTQHITEGLAIADANGLVDVGIYLDRARLAAEAIWVKDDGRRPLPTSRFPMDR